MSNILKLLKNEKVEWKRLGEVIQKHSEKAKKVKDISLVYTVSKEDGIIPSIEYWTKTASKQRVSYEMYSADTSNYYVIRKNMFAYNPARLNIGSIGCLFEKEEGLLSPMYVVFKIDENILNPKYLLYFLKQPRVIKQIDDMKELGARFRFDFNNWNKIKIPIPSLETQEKIVNMLDKFTNYITELQTELQMRTQQYEYYLNLLLSEDYLCKLSTKLENKPINFECKNLRDISIGCLTYGSGASAIPFDGLTRYIRITDINDGGYLNKEKVSPNIIEKKYFLNKGDILFARSGATVGKNYIHLDEEQSIYAGYLIRLIVNPEIALPKFVYYCLNTINYKKFIEGTKGNSSKPNINAQQYGEFEILVPSLNVQNYIVEILDKFHTIVYDLQIGLPREIELRQQQYEYYREKLLSFNDNGE